MRSILLPIPLMAVALAACDAGTPPAAPAADSAGATYSQPGTLPATTAAQPAGDGLSPASITAWGKDWRAAVDKNVMTLSGAGMATAPIPVTTVATSDGVAYDGGADGSLRIQRGQCSDDRGRSTAYTAVLLIGAKKVIGCAEAAAIDNAQR